MLVQFMDNMEDTGAGSGFGLRRIAVTRDPDRR
jgi:hypothetical protein